MKDKYFIQYIIIINILSFILCYLDKKLAIKHKYRLSETFLLSLCTIGGTFGLLLGMHLFHHKTKKIKFKLVYITSLIWIFIIYKLYI
ncbi:MAG: DUF1294 domain-containing protein [Bacilli bacterium]|nr:DUF1294 domain-containing protein [Bacilli bacterium]